MIKFVYIAVISICFAPAFVSAASIRPILNFKCWINQAEIGLSDDSSAQAYEPSISGDILFQTQFKISRGETYESQAFHLPGSGLEFKIFMSYATDALAFVQGQTASVDMPSTPHLLVGIINESGLQKPPLTAVPGFKKRNGILAAKEFLVHGGNLGSELYFRAKQSLLSLTCQISDG